MLNVECFTYSMVWSNLSKTYGAKNKERQNTELYWVLIVSLANLEINDPIFQQTIHYFVYIYLQLHCWRANYWLQCSEPTSEYPDRNMITIIFRLIILPLKYQTMAVCLELILYLRTNLIAVPDQPDLML